MGWFPSAEALGYFHSSALPTFAAKPLHRLFWAKSWKWIPT